MAAFMATSSRKTISRPRRVHVRSVASRGRRRLNLQQQVVSTPSCYARAPRLQLPSAAGSINLDANTSGETYEEVDRNIFNRDFGRRFVGAGSGGQGSRMG